MLFQLIPAMKQHLRGHNSKLMMMMMMWKQQWNNAWKKWTFISVERGTGKLIPWYVYHQS